MDILNTSKEKVLVIFLTILALILFKLSYDFWSYRKNQDLKEIESLKIELNTKKNE